MAFVDPRDDGLATADSGPAFTLRYALPGLVAGTVMAIGALGVGWLPIDGLADVPLVHALRTDTVGAFVSRASVILGGALLLQAWLDKGVLDTTLQVEPFFQFKRVQLQNLVQGYEDKLDRQALLPAGTPREAGRGP